MEDRDINTAQKNCSVNRTAFAVKVMQKVLVMGSTGDLWDKYEYMFYGKEKQHFYHTDHQYKALQNMERSTMVQEICLHVNFAENQTCKLFLEIQLTHFAASRSQVSRHNIVAYTHTHTHHLEPYTSAVSDSVKYDHSPCHMIHMHPMLSDQEERLPYENVLHLITSNSVLMQKQLLRCLLRCSFNIGRQF
jgi:hypothetical protein